MLAEAFVGERVKHNTDMTHCSRTEEADGKSLQDFLEILKSSLPNFLKTFPLHLIMSHEHMFV